MLFQAKDSYRGNDSISSLSSKDSSDMDEMHWTKLRLRFRITTRRMYASTPKSSLRDTRISRVSFVSTSLDDEY